MRVDAMFWLILIWFPTVGLESWPLLFYNCFAPNQLIMAQRIRENCQATSMPERRFRLLVSFVVPFCPPVRKSKYSKMAYLDTEYACQKLGLPRIILNYQRFDLYFLSSSVHSILWGVLTLHSSTYHFLSLRFLTRKMSIINASE